jgi:hypothetical protein
MSGNKFGVRTKDGRWQKAGNLSSAVKSALHSGDVTGVDHEVASINDLTGEVTTVKIPAPRVRRPAAGNTAARVSTGRS